MAHQFQQLFDARSVDPSQVNVPLPIGDYPVAVSDSEVKATSAGDGGYLELTLRVLAGQFINRELPYRLNLWNKSQQAVDIAYRQLSALCHVTGQFQLQTSQQLHGIPFLAVVGLSKNDPNYNDIKGVKDVNGNAPGKQGTTGVASALPTATVAPVMPPASPAAPWGQPPPTAAPQQQQPPAQSPTPWAQPGQGPWQPPAPSTMPPPPAVQPAMPWGAPPPAQAPAQPQAAPPWAQPQGAPQAQQAPWAQQPAAAPAAPTWPPR